MSAKWNFPPKTPDAPNMDFLCQVCQVAVDAGATVLNLPDTVGYAVPEEYGAMFRSVREHLGDPDTGLP